MRKLRNENGFTLIGLLIVVTVIAILFVFLVPQIDNASIRAREAGVKTDFQSMQLGMTMFFNESVGKVTRLNDTEDFNPYLDQSMRITNLSGGDTNGDGYLDAVATGQFAKKDPWGNEYQIIQMASVDWVTGIKVVI